MDYKKGSRSGLQRRVGLEWAAKEGGAGVGCKGGLVGRTAQIALYSISQ